jgi:hypothetical protein
MTAVTEGSGAATWRGLTARQQPGWPDRQRLKAVTSELAALPPLIFADECDQLRERLAAVTRGEAFILQGGDCAETFEGATAGAVRAKLQTLLQMALVLTYGASVPVVKIARMAGQFAKPRSSQTETRDGVELPAYRGDAVNGFDFTPEARTPDPDRLLRAYHSSAVTLNLCRAYTTGGCADLRRAHAWNQDFVRTSPSGQNYERLVGEIDRALAFMHACGADPQELRSVELYSSHEALLLDYEDALTPGCGMTPRRTSCGSVSGPGPLVTRTSNSPAASTTPSGSSWAPPPRPRRSSRSPRRSTRTACPGGSPSSPGWEPRGSVTSCRPWSRRSAEPGRRSPGSVTRCTATPSRRRAATRRGGSATSWPRCTGSSRSTGRSAPTRAEYTWSSPATT